MLAEERFALILNLLRGKTHRHRAGAVRGT